jgi:hypothetical protein
MRQCVISIHNTILQKRCLTGIYFSVYVMGTAANGDLKSTNLDLCSVCFKDFLLHVTLNMLYTEVENVASKISVLEGFECWPEQESSVQCWDPRILCSWVDAKGFSGLWRGHRVNLTICLHLVPRLMCGVSSVLRHMPLRYAEGQLPFRCVCVGTFISHFFFCYYRVLRRMPVSNSGSEGK